MGAKKGFGGVLEYDSTGAGAWVAIANVTKVRPFDAKVDVIDGTSHDSPSETREKLAGLKDMGALVADLNYDDQAASHQWLKTNLGVETPFRFTFPDTGDVATFDGFVKQVSPEVPHDNKMTCSVAIEINGVVTIT